MTPSSTLARDIVTSPLGELELTAADSGLVSIFFQHHKRPRPREAALAPEHPVIVHTRRELEQYFAGLRRHFETPLAPPELLGGTPFQLAVWAALRTIPFGETRSYAEIAQQIGRPNAVRAVGAANGLNPISILVPCHRVIGSSGALTGYAGGIENKRWLLTHETPACSRNLFRAHSVGVAKH